MTSPPLQAAGGIHGCGGDVGACGLNNTSVRQETDREEPPIRVHGGPIVGVSRARRPHPPSTGSPGPKCGELFRTELDLAFFTMCAATDLESQRHSFAFFSETNLSACGFGRKITLLDNVMPRALQLIGQLSKQKFAFNFPIVSRPIVHLHKVRMLNAMDLLSRFSRSIGLTLKLYGNQASPHRHLRSRKEPIAHRADCWIARSVETCNDIRATEKSIQANVQLSCLWTKLVVNLMRAR